MMNYLVVDISTSAQIGIEDSPYLSWASKKGSTTPEEAYAKAGLHAEYGMICGLSVFKITFEFENDSPTEYKSEHCFTMSAKNKLEEENMLLKFNELIFKMGTNIKFVGQNTKDFIIPFIAKRYLANGLKVPEQIYNAIHFGTFDVMKELACGGVSVMSLRSSAWLFGIDDPRSSMRVPRFYELCISGKMKEIELFNKINCRVAADVFGNCVLGNLIKL